MQSNNNAGIITYRGTKMPRLLSVLAKPKLESSVVIAGGTHEINIYLFDCPVNGDKVDKKRYRLLRELVDRNKVNFLVERFEIAVQSNVTPRKSEIHYSQMLAEVRAIKQLAALIKISEERHENLLASSIGFIIGNIDHFIIDLLSEEASNVMLYEGRTLTEELKTNLHNHFMEKKGVSIVFTKDIKNIIINSSIIYIDENAELSGCQELLKNKVVIGKSKDKHLRCIHNIILWSAALGSYGADNIPLIYNDEILAIMRYYDIKMDIIDFIKRLPFIKFDY